MFNVKEKMVRTISTMALSAVILGGGLSVHANELKTIQMPVEESIVSYIESRTELSKAQKDRLISAELEKEAIYERINELNTKIREIESPILQEANPVFDKIYAIKDAHINLVKKMDANINSRQKGAREYKEYVNLSGVLSRAEKLRLIEDYDKMNELYKEVGDYYKKAAKASLSLKEELKGLQDKIRAIDEKNDEIWDELYK